MFIVYLSCLTRSRLLRNSISLNVSSFLLLYCSSAVVADAIRDSQILFFFGTPIFLSVPYILPLVVLPNFYSHHIQHNNQFQCQLIHSVLSISLLVVEPPRVTCTTASCFVPCFFFFYYFYSTPYLVLFLLFSTAHLNSICVCA